jgi:hypothetical protein
MIEYLPLVLTGIGIIVSILYYAMVLQNANKTQKIQLETRQAQLFMHIFQSFNSPESNKIMAELLTVELGDYDDFAQKYAHTVNPEHFGERTHVFYSFHIIGRLLEDGLITIELVDTALGLSIVLLWDKWGYLIKEIREEMGYPRYVEYFEYLYEELNKYWQENPSKVQIKT